MKFRAYLFIFIVVLLLFSCVKKKENNNESVQQETEQDSIEISVIETEENKNNVSYKTYALDDETRELIRSKVKATDEEKEAMKELREPLKTNTKTEKMIYNKKHETERIF